MKKLIRLVLLAMVINICFSSCAVFCPVPDKETGEMRKAYKDTNKSSKNHSAKRNKGPRF